MGAGGELTKAASSLRPSGRLLEDVFQPIITQTQSAPFVKGMNIIALGLVSGVG